MTSSEKNHWRVVLTYGGLLVISLLVFLVHPNWRRPGGAAWNDLFQILGPTIGTFVLSAIMLVRMAGRKISLVNGILAVLLLAAISLGCLAVTMPIFMRV